MIDADRMKIILAEELEKRGEKGLASLLRRGFAASLIVDGALAAMTRTQDEAIAELLEANAHAAEVARDRHDRPGGEE